MPNLQPDGRIRRSVLGLIAFAFCVIPTFTAKEPPLGDYPGHLARISILKALTDSADGFYHHVYVLTGFLLPNVGMDIVALGFSRFMSVESAGRLFLVLTLVLTLTGSTALAQVLFGRVTIAPFIGSVYLYNWILLSGFVNYLFGVALMLWGLACWIVLSTKSRSMRIAMGTVLTALLFFAHMVALGLFAVLVCGFELQNAFGKWRSGHRFPFDDILTAGVPFILPFVLFTLSSTMKIGGTYNIYYYPAWWFKPFVFARTFLAGNIYLDVATLFGLLFLALILITVAHVRFAREMILPLVFLAASFIVAPWSLFSAYHVDARIPIALWFVAASSIEIDLSDAALQWMRLAPMLVATILLARTAVISWDWKNFDQIHDQFRDAFRLMPAGSILIAATTRQPPRNITEWMDRWRPSLIHEASLASLDGLVYAPSTFAERGQQPIEAQKDYAEADALQGGPAILLDANKTLPMVVGDIRRTEAGMDGLAPFYLLVLYPGDLAQFPPPNTELIARGSRFILMHVDPETAEEIRSEGDSEDRDRPAKLDRRE